MRLKKKIRKLEKRIADLEVQVQSQPVIQSSELVIDGIATDRDSDDLINEYCQKLESAIKATIH